MTVSSNAFVDESVNIFKLQYLNGIFPNQNRKITMQLILLTSLAQAKVYSPFMSKVSKGEGESPDHVILNVNSANT